MPFKVQITDSCHENKPANPIIMNWQYKNQPN